MNTENIQPESGAPAAAQPSATQSSAPQPSAPQPAAPRPSVPTTPGPRPVRSSTIAWGIIVLAACAFVAQQTLAPGTLNTTAWVTAVVLGLGVLLLVVGVAAVIRQARRASRE